MKTDAGTMTATTHLINNKFPPKWNVVLFVLVPGDSFIQAASLLPNPVYNL